MIKTLLRWPRAILGCSICFYLILVMLAIVLGYVRIDVVSERDFIVDDGADLKIRDYEALKVAESSS